jgi:hypothetical protein
MLKRHEDALASRIDKVTQHGWALLEWWELYLWYDMDRLGKKVWRDLHDRFREQNEKVKGELHFYEGVDGLLLIHPEGLKPISEKTGNHDE